MKFRLNIRVDSGYISYCNWAARGEPQLLHGPCKDATVTTLHVVM